MAFFNDNVFDSGLAWLTANMSRTDICSQEPTTYVEATSTYSLGNKTGQTCGSPENGDVDGRKVVMPAITDGSVTATATATHFAHSDGATLLGATNSLSASQAVTSGNPFSLAASDHTLRDAA